MYGLHCVLRHYFSVSLSLRGEYIIELRHHSLHHEHQEIIHIVALNEVILLEQPISRLLRLANDNITSYPMILAVPVAINNPNLRSRPQWQSRSPARTFRNNSIGCSTS